MRLAVALTLALAAFARLTAACAPSELLVGGCELQGARGARVHYLLKNDQLSVAVRAETEGYVGVWFTPASQTTLLPGDAVVGAGDPDGAWSVMPLQINANDVIESGVPISSFSCVQADGATTLRFTRPLRAGRFPLRPEAVRIVVAVGATDEFGDFADAGEAFLANLSSGVPAPTRTSSPVVLKPGPSPEPPSPSSPSPSPPPPVPPNTSAVKSGASRGVASLVNVAALLSSVAALLSSVVF